MSIVINTPTSNIGRAFAARLDSAEPRTPDTTPTTLAEFARTTLAPAIRAKIGV